MRATDVVGAVRDARATSEVARALEQARHVGSLGIRLTDGQVTELESRGNTSADWGRVRVSPNFKPEFVRSCYFQGDVYLGAFGPPVPVAQGLKLASGVYGVRVVDAAIDDGALVQDTRLVVRAVVAREAVVIGVGELLGYPNSRFGLGIAVRVGIETGGRDVALYPEITIPVAARVATERRDTRMLSTYSDAVRAYSDALVSDVTLVCPGAHIYYTPYVRASFIGDRTLVDSAAGIDGSVILSSEREPTEISAGAFVRRSVIQWGCRIVSGALVEESAVLERSTVARHGTVISSIIGPCSAIEKGEVTSSLLGPLTALHHQAMLIAALWSEGKGNVSAGALVGSNHTSRAADQEILPGEGAFFGLGSRVKFPCDFSRAPYTVFAAGVTVPSQRIEFPFSLIRAGRPVLLAAAGIDALPDANEIVPAWTITESAYTIARTERKFRHRCRAQRHVIDPDPLRPEVLAVCRAARDRLAAASPKDVYTRDDIPGLGSNVLSERSRLSAIAGYTSVLVAKSLAGLWERAKACATSDGVTGAWLGGEGLGDEAREGWDLHLSILRAERPGVPLRRLLEELVEVQGAFVESVRASKRRDDERGAAVIPGYADAHEHVDEDRVLKDLVGEYEELRRAIQEFLGRLAGDGPAV